MKDKLIITRWIRGGFIDEVFIQLMMVFVFIHGIILYGEYMDYSLLFEALGKQLCKLSLDWFIIVLGLANIFIFFVPLRKMVNNLFKQYKDVKYNIDLSKESKEILENCTPKPVDGNVFLGEREKMVSLYALFLNITSSLPLLGMFGTVMALIPMVNEIGTNIQDNFFVALTSTFWGLFFSIVLKLVDTYLSTKIEIIRELEPIAKMNKTLEETETTK